MTRTPIPAVTNTTMATTALSSNCILSLAVAHLVSAVLPGRALGLGLHPGHRGGRSGARPRRGGAPPQHRWWTLTCARASGSSSHPIQLGGGSCGANRWLCARTEVGTWSCYPANYFGGVVRERWSVYWVMLRLRRRGAIQVPLWHCFA